MELIIKISGGFILAAGILNLMYGATDSYRCSHNIAPEAFQDWCIDQRREVKRIEAVTQAIKEQRAREAACDHRGWFGLVGKNECSSSPDLAAQPR